jgi:hypothetical protein
MQRQEGRERSGSPGTTASIDEIVAQDVTGQKSTRLTDLPVDLSVGDIVESVLREMRMPPNDSEGRPLSYRALLKGREERHLHQSERAGDCIESGDTLVIQPSVDAGGMR